MRGGGAVEKIGVLTEKVAERLVELIENKTPTKEEVDVLQILSTLLINLIIDYRRTRHS